LLVATPRRLEQRSKDGGFRRYGSASHCKSHAHGADLLQNQGSEERACWHRRPRQHQRALVQLEGAWHAQTVFGVVGGAQQLQKRRHQRLGCC
jgi:hypothetical protein